MGMWLQFTNKQLQISDGESNTVYVQNFNLFSHFLKYEIYALNFVFLKK